MSATLFTFKPNQDVQEKMNTTIPELEPVVVAMESSDILETIKDISQEYANQNNRYNSRILIAICMTLLFIIMSGLGILLSVILPIFLSVSYIPWVTICFALALSLFACSTVVVGFLGTQWKRYLIRASMDQYLTLSSSEYFIIVRSYLLGSNFVMEIMYHNIPIPVFCSLETKGSVTLFCKHSKPCEYSLQDHEDFSKHVVVTFHDEEKPLSG